MTIPKYINTCLSFGCNTAYGFSFYGGWKMDSISVGGISPKFRTIKKDGLQIYTVEYGGKTYQKNTENALRVSDKFIRNCDAWFVKNGFTEQKEGEMCEQLFY